MSKVEKLRRTDWLGQDGARDFDPERAARAERRITPSLRHGSQRDGLTGCLRVCRVERLPRVGLAGFGWLGLSVWGVLFENSTVCL